MHHRLPSRFAAAFLLGLTVLTGCASDAPQMSGLAIGNVRVVGVGDLVTLRTPLTKDGGRQWQVTSYDSLYLAIADRPRLEQRSDGTYEVVTRAEARTPGETEVRIQEIAPPPGRSARTVTFKVRIAG